MTHDKTTDLTAADLVEMYRLMLLGRCFTETARELYRQGRASPIHPSIGQEAVGVGACYALRSGDWVIPSLRTTEAFWARGVTIQEKVNALLGNAGSISRGKEGSHHAGYPDRGIMAGTGIIGSQFPVATGAALALRMQGTDNVVVCFFGDGASNRGDCHEGLNLAAVLKAPVIFICENNIYAQTVPASDAMVITDIADRAVGYGMPGLVVDGQDVLAVHGATQAAVHRARSGQGPKALARVRDEAHRLGMKLIPYVSPYYSNSPDLIANMDRILTEYEVDGLYFDGWIGKREDFRPRYRLMRQARAILGDRLLCLHSSTEPYGNCRVYLPFVEAYADFVLSGESGRSGLDLEPFLRYTVSGHQISNTVGMWCYYGSWSEELRHGGEYNNIVPTIEHIEMALRNHVRFWRTAQRWSKQAPEELARFDRPSRPWVSLRCTMPRALRPERRMRLPRRIMRCCGGSGRHGGRKGRRGLCL